jgi:hypothetical protein
MFGDHVSGCGWEDNTMDPSRRLSLQALLETLLGSDHVYFQPPPGEQILYPCIIYKRDNASTDFANNFGYRFQQRYQVTYISSGSPDTGMVEKLARLPLCLYNRFYVAQNLNHDVFNLYF